MAAQSIVKQIAPTAAPQPLRPPAQLAQVFERGSPSRGRQQVARKANRATLAVRTQPIDGGDGEPLKASPQVVASSPARLIAEPAASSAAAAPTQLSAPPPQFQAQFQPQFQPILTPIEQPNGPALNSFRGLSNSVTARHSALMAQVAAERQAASTSSDFSNSQPSLGSPLEALSTPSVAQLQPPPTLHQAVASTTIGAAASPSLNFVNQPEEPIVAPSFEHVLSQGCPHKGVFSYENKDHCDRYYMCTNGTFTEEACPNGLAYSQMGAVYQHCAYNWNVDCGNKKTSEPLASPGCPWQFGIFPVSSAGRCSIDYFVCEWGVPETKRCTPEGLFYDDRIKGCQWADQLGCKSEALLNFKCPSEDEDNPYWPYPRYYHTKQDVIVCVNEQPRLVHCNEEQTVDPSSLACIDLRKKKKKF